MTIKPSLLLEELSPESKAKIEAVRFKAAAELDQAHKEPPEPFTEELHDTLAFLLYVDRVTLAHAHEVNNLARHGMLTMDRVWPAIDTFFEEFALEAYPEKGIDRNGQPLQIIDEDGKLLLIKLKQNIRRDSDGWQKLNRKLLATANKLSKKTSSPGKPDQGRRRGLQKNTKTDQTTKRPVISKSLYAAYKAGRTCDEVAYSLGISVSALHSLKAENPKSRIRVGTDKCTEIVEKITREVRAKNADFR